MVELYARAGGDVNRRKNRAQAAAAARLIQSRDSTTVAP